MTKPLEATPFRFLQLVADPHRWALLQELARSDRRVGELCDLVGKPQNLVSYHLGALRSGGLIASRRSTYDGRDTYYRVDLARCGEMLADAGVALHPGLRTTPQPVVPVKRRRPPRVLFLCTGNSARSQMAEALLEHMSDYTIEARSAGSNPKPLHSDAIRVMAERGIDIADHQSKHLSTFTQTRFDQVITLCDKVKEVCPTLPGQPTNSHWSIADPSIGAENTYPLFVRTANELEQRIRFLIAQINDTTGSHTRRTT